jgi:PAS domain S-box-containing protein
MAHSWKRDLGWWVGLILSGLALNGILFYHHSALAVGLAGALNLVLLVLVAVLIRRGLLRRERDARALRASEEQFRLTQRALRASEARFQRLADSNLIGVLQADLAGPIRAANDAFLSIVGYTRADLQAGRLDAWQMTPPEYRGVDEEMARALRSQGVSRSVEKEFFRKDGSRAAVLIGAARVDDAGGEGQWVAFVVDLTERKRSEEEVRRLNDTLERRVQERTQQFQEANRELEGFSYSVSHDLRAPLRHIAGFADLLRKRDDDRLDETGRRYTRVIADAARQAGRLVDDLLGFSRMGRAALQHGEVDMDRLVAEVKQEVEGEEGGGSDDGTADSPPGRVTWRVGPLPVVEGDAAMLRLVVRNLLSNALKYSRRRERAEIQVGSTPADGEVIFFVRDNGVGFDMRYAGKLFGVFQRLHPSGEYEGTGIGLANVRRIIARHGGRTWAEGKPDGGATFYFSLPCRAGEGVDEGRAPGPSGDRLVVNGRVLMSERKRILNQPPPGA